MPGYLGARPEPKSSSIPLHRNATSSTFSEGTILSILTTSDYTLVDTSSSRPQAHTSRPPKPLSLDLALPLVNLLPTQGNTAGHKKPDGSGAAYLQTLGRPLTMHTRLFLMWHRRARPMSLNWLVNRLAVLGRVSAKGWAVSSKEGEERAEVVETEEWRKWRWWELQTRWGLWKR